MGEAACLRTEGIYEISVLSPQFCCKPKIALKKNETKLHQATQDQCVIKRGIVLKDLFQCQPFFKSLYLNLLQYWSCFMF